MTQVEAREGDLCALPCHLVVHLPFYVRWPRCAVQNEVESLRLKTKDYEMVLAQHGNFTLIVIQQTANKKQSEEDKEGEAAAPTEAKKD